MSSLLSIGETIALLQNLREKINALTAREQVLTRNGQSIARKQSHSIQSRVVEEEERFAAVVQESESALSMDRQIFNTWNCRRKAHSKKAHTNAKMQAQAQIERAKGQEIYAVQQGTLAAGRTKEEALAANETRKQERSRDLENARLYLRAIEQKARTAFCGYGAFRRLLIGLSIGTVTGGSNEMMGEFVSLYHKSQEDIARFPGDRCGRDAHEGSTRGLPNSRREGVSIRNRAHRK